MPQRIFTFIQMELPWELGPADGRYLLRTISGPQEGDPQHVVVLSTLGAERRGLLGNRSRVRARRADPQPTTVPIARATVIDPVALSTEAQGDAWLKQLDPEREAQAATDVLNRLLFSHRIASALPYVREVSPSQALIVRAGYGEGDHVAEGLWIEAREVLLSHQRSGRRASVLRPQERLAAMLSGREHALLCEELTLRARADLDAGRVELAAIELERAYAAALAEIPREAREDLAARLGELHELYVGLQPIASAAMPTPEGDPAQIERPTLQRALERLEAALRARTAPGV